MSVSCKTLSTAFFALGAYEKVLACKDIAALLNNSPEAVIPDVKGACRPIPEKAHGAGGAVRRGGGRRQ